MKHRKNTIGFSLLEALLAIVVITAAGVGVYELFDSGLSSSKLSDTTDEMVEIASVYTDLASADLTGDVPTTSIETVLKNSGRLSAKYFTETDSGSGATTVSMLNVYGALTFSETSPYGFTVSVPLGCLPANSSTPEQLWNKVQDVYAAHTVTPCANETQTMVTLTYSLNT